MILLTTLLIISASNSWTMPTDFEDLQVLVWNNDNDSQYINEMGESINCEVGLEEALAENGVDYITVHEDSLPQDLSDYDIVFVELGVYCVG